MSYVDASRVIPILQEHVEKSHYFMDGSGKWTGGTNNVSFQTGVSPKFMFEIMHGRKEKVKDSKLDDILTGLGLQHLAWREPEEGGFKDVYDKIKTRAPIARDNEARNRAKKKPCPTCDGLMHHTSTRCQTCRDKLEALKRKVCKECGKRFQGGYRRTTGLCRDCYDRAGGGFALAKDTEGVQRYKKQHERFFVEGGGNGYGA